MQPIRQHHLLMFDFGKLPEQTLKIAAGAGYFTLPAAFVDAHTGAVVREVQLNLRGPVEMHFTASRKDVFAGWWYMQQYDRAAKNWRCTCLECKQFSWCEHLVPLAAPVVVA